MDNFIIDHNLNEYNIVVKNENLLSTDVELFFVDNEENIPNLIYVEPNKNIWDILVFCDVYKSKTQARNDPRFKNSIIPLGYNEFILGKMRKRIYIINPLPYIDCN